MAQLTIHIGSAEMEIWSYILEKIVHHVYNIIYCYYAVIVHISWYIVYSHCSRCIVCIV